MPNEETLESRITKLEVRMAVAESNIETVKGDIKNIKDNTNKLIWLVGSAIVLAILNLVLKGGVIH